MKFSQSVQGWRSRWFYVKDEASADGEPLVKMGVPVIHRKSWRNELTAEEKRQTDGLMDQIATLRGKELTGVHLASTFLKHRIQPLQARVHSMWAYSGASHPTRVRNEELSTNELEDNVRAITKIRADDSCEATPPIAPFGAGNAPTKVNFSCL
jgi:hypothetical protein